MPSTRNAAHTGGAYELFEVDAPRGPTVPPHATPWATFTVHSPSVQSLAFFLTGAMGRFFRDVDRAVPADAPPADAAPALREVVGRHGITMGEWSS
ncbi:hypothetical protein [Saccharothrix sp. 6-C]|uniref:hypothetical protein n=1 Tax=Saccharothrix sp. 6-C TaxID=2781735 RepID=UPI001F1FD7F0|nr:hypothetical protein [Saccharothrix sp. 6-C]